MNTSSSIVLSKAFPSAWEQLATIDNDWANLISRVGPGTTPVPQTMEPYEALIRAIAAQQMDPHAGVRHLEQFLTLFPSTPFPTPSDIISAGLPALKACGFGRTKASVLLGIAKAVIDGSIPSRREAVNMTDDALVARIADLPGVGRWTVDMFLIDTLGRMDVLPADDFRVCEGYRHLKCLKTTPTPDQMRAFAKKWAPLRSTATYYLVRCKEGFSVHDPNVRLQAATQHPASAITSPSNFFRHCRNSRGLTA